MRNLIQVLTLLTCSVIFAQLPQDMLNSSKKITKFEKYAGSIYSNKEFQKSNIVYKNEKSFDLPLNYNIYTDAIEYEKNLDLFEIAKDPATFAQINGDYYYYCDFKTNRGQSRKGYYVLVEANESYRIYKKYEVEITDPAEKESMPGNFTMGKIKLVTTFYQEKNDVISDLPMNKKDILAAFYGSQ